MSKYSKNKTGASPNEQKGSSPVSCSYEYSYTCPIDETPINTMIQHTQTTGATGGSVKDSTATESIDATGGSAKDSQTTIAATGPSSSISTSTTKATVSTGSATGESVKEV